MKIKIKAIEKKVISAGEHLVLKDGFLFERLQVKGSKVNISKEFLAEHKKKHGKDFESSWLEPTKKASTRKPAAKPSAAEQE